MEVQRAQINFPKSYNWNSNTHLPGQMGHDWERSGDCYMRYNSDCLSQGDSVSFVTWAKSPFNVFLSSN